MTNHKPSDLTCPLTQQQLSQLKAIISDFNKTQLTWFSGYLLGIANATYSISSSFSVKQQLPTITIISASQTGNARKISEQFFNDLLVAKLKVNLINAGDYKFKQISQEKILIFITSTQGEGEPPEEAVALYNFLMSKKAPKFENTSFAIFGLGDTSYEFFSQTGKDLDRRLFELGAKRLLERVDADINYNEQAIVWRKQLTEILKHQTSNEVDENRLEQDIIFTNSIIKKLPVNKSIYTKEKPLIANILVNQKITGRNSKNDVRHIEIDLGNSELIYKPGDALGIWYENEKSLVQELIQLLCLKEDEPVQVRNNMWPLNEALQKFFELTVNTPQIVKQYATLSSNKKLLILANNKENLQDYAHKFPIVDMIRQHPTMLDSIQLTKLLRPLTPRYYSISSSQAENKTEVHITVNVVRYEIDGHIRGGGASTWLAKHIEEDSKIQIFLEKKDNFRLPTDSEIPIIMICAGTGIAPFRAFMQQRDNDKSKGKNWLFFGNPNFTEDFLYQIEWQKYVKDGLLTNIDLAWSRDQNEKVYVQDRIRDKGSEIWCWIEQGAYIYVCGDAHHMAKGVNQALIDVIIVHGNMDREKADEFLSELRVKRRYQRDIY